MNTLTSKVQHDTFEVGEFVDRGERTYEETIRLIETFPWETERKTLAVSLTNPSITVEGKNGDFLKLSLFYNGKFVLHYFDHHQKLFTKSFTNITDTYSYVKGFFEQSTFDTSEFKLENTWLQHNLQHFVSQDFHYTANRSTVKRFLISTSGFGLAMSLIMFIFLIIKADNTANYYAVFVIYFIFFFIAGGGLNLIVFFNFYSYAKNKILIMSKGNDVFYFGDIVDPKKYDKSEIAGFRIIRLDANRNPLSSFAIVTIELKDGTQLKIPNLLVDYIAMKQKLSGIPFVEENKTPFIRK
jgi:hypothetical protein